MDRKVVETRPNGDIKTTITEWGKVTSLISTRYDAMLDANVNVFEQSLTYDEAGNVTHEVRKQNDVITTIDNQYNSRGELTQSSQETGLNKVVYQYTMSPFGNKSENIDYYANSEFVLRESKAYVYNHLNQLESSTINGITVEYDYDDYGNLVEESNGTYTKTYSYDLNNRLIEVIEGSQTLQFSYDGSGNRLSKSINAIEVNYINDTSIENEQVLSYKVGADVTNITFGLGRLNEDGSGYLSDSYGNIVQHGSENYAYTPYGELTQGIIDGVNEAGYKGEIHDSSSLQYLRARTYNSKLKQFIQEDTYVGKDTHPLSQNRYAFVLNNPFKYSDPSGHIALPYHLEDKWSTSGYKPTSLNNTKLSTVKKTVTNIPKNVVTAKLGNLYNNEAQQNQKSLKSSQVIAETANKNNDKLEVTAKSKSKDQVVGFTEQSSKKESFFGNIWNGVKSIGSDIGEMALNVGNAVASGVSNIAGDFGNSINSAMKGDWKAAGKSAFSGVSKLASAAGDILTTPAKQVVEGVKSVINGVIEVGQAVGYAMDGEWEAAGKSALSGVTNVIGGATSVALVASTVLVAFNPVAAAVVAGYAMYGGIAESGLGLAQNVVGQMTNDSGYAKKGSAHFVSGALKALTANRIKNLANKKIAQNEAKQLLKEEIEKQPEQVDKFNKTGIEDKIKSNGKSETLQSNKIKGKLFENQEFAKFKNKYTDASEQITIKTPSGTKVRVDAIGLDGSGTVVINEFKSSITAILTNNQKIAFPEIFKNGGIVVGEGKGIFTGGYEIPTGTQVSIIRP